MTLHSAASCYSDTPSDSERALMNVWLDMFQSTITCPSCNQHFHEALTSYRQRTPTMLSSRKDLMLFTFRVHNTVNQRINKPIYPTVEACFETLRTNVKTRTARDYRLSYLRHIRRHWRTMQDTSGFTALKKINEMDKIEGTYFQTHDNNFEIGIPDDVVLLSAAAFVPPNTAVPIPARILPSVRLVGGRLRART